MTCLPVLIVGAGPTGLMMAGELARRGVKFRLIDKQPAATLSTNATWIQARTLEIFDHIGVIKQFLKQGHRCHAINFYIKDKPLVNIPLKYIDSVYPFILMLPQYKTEQILTEYLAAMHGHIERSTELVAVTQRDHTVITQIKRADGQIETITSQWLIACDGANSTVRQKCEILFPGEMLSEQFIVADTVMDSYLSPDEAHLFFNRATIFMAMPWGDNHYRINANLHLATPRKMYSEIEVKELAAERTYGNYVVEKISQISPFWIQSKVVNHLQLDAIFFAGDAAHIHSPIGGQGMNMGIHDAYNLAWKLALVIQEKAKISMLESYQAERRPIIKEVVDRTEMLTKMVLNDHAFLNKLRSFGRKILRSQVRLSKKVGTDLAQLNVRYLHGDIIDLGGVSTRSPRAGSRAPNVFLTSTTSLYDYFRNTEHNVLIFTGVAATQAILDKIVELQHKLEHHYPSLIKVWMVTRAAMAKGHQVIVDADGHAYTRYHVKTSTIFVIRPDTYIACRSKQLKFSSLDRLLRRYLLGQH